MFGDHTARQLKEGGDRWGSTRPPYTIIIGTVSKNLSEFKKRLSARALRTMERDDDISDVSSKNGYLDLLINLYGNNRRL